MPQKGSEKQQSPDYSIQDADYLFRDARNYYWCHETEDHVDETFSAAGEAGDGAMNRKIGDFYRFEFSECNAQLFYVNALRKDLAEAEKGNADAMFALAEQFALGFGVPQDSEKAAFWLQEAARHGSHAAREMMPNLWQDGTVLPINANIAKKLDTYSPDPFPQASGELEALRKAAVKKEVSAERYAVAQFLYQKKFQTCKVTNLYHTPPAEKQRKRKERFLSVSRAVDKYIIIAILICFLITRFTGYRETGIFHFTGLVTYVFLFPVHAVYALFKGGLFKADFSMQALCSRLCMNLPWENASKDLRIIENGIFFNIIPLLLMLLWLYLLIRMVNAYISRRLDRNPIQGMVYSDHRAVINSEMCKRTAAAAQKAQQQLAYLLQKYAIPQDMSSPAILLALYDYAAFSNIASVSEAVAGYRAMLEQKEKPTILLRFGSSTSFLVHLFLVNRYVPACKKYAGICVNPVYNFPRFSCFMKGYRKYRCGRYYSVAEEEFRKSIESGEEIAFSNWFLSEIYESVHWSVYQEEEKRVAHNAACLEKANAFKNAAKVAGCPHAQTDAVSAFTLVWQLHPNALRAFSDRLPFLHGVEDYYRRIVENEEERRRDCGDDSITDRPDALYPGEAWSAFASALSWISSINRENETFYLSMAQDELKSALNSGILRVQELYDIVTERIKTLHRIRAEEAKMRAFWEAEKMRQRNRQIAAEMYKWDSERDAHEKTRNAILYGTYETDSILNAGGGMSDMDYLFHQSRRFDARKEKEEEIWNAVYAEDNNQHSYDDDDSDDADDRWDSDDYPYDHSANADDLDGAGEDFDADDLDGDGDGFDADDFDDDDSLDDDDFNDDFGFDDLDDDFDYE